MIHYHYGVLHLMMISDQIGPNSNLCCLIISLSAICTVCWIAPFNEKNEGKSEILMGGLTYLLAAVESLTFLPSKEAKCCSRASRRLLGACCDRESTISKFLRSRKCGLYGHQDHKGQWWATKIDGAENTMIWTTPFKPRCRQPIDVFWSGG